MTQGPRDHRQVAQLHTDCIDQGFLSQLGVEFLTLMYECLDAAPEALLLTCERGGRVAGFVSSGASLGGVYRRMLMRPWRLVRSLAPSLLQPRRLRRILEILRYSASHGDAADLPSTELLSLAVAPHWRGSGCADELFIGLEKALAARGEPAFKIIVGNSLVPAHRFYRRMGAVPVANIEVHRGELSTVYVKQLVAGHALLRTRTTGAQQDNETSTRGTLDRPLLSRTKYLRALPCRLYRHRRFGRRAARLSCS